MNCLRAAVGAFFAASMCGVLFNVRGKDLVYTGVIAGAAAAVERIARQAGADPVLSTFYAGLTFSLLSELFARLCKTPVTTYLPSVLIPFVPGRLMLYMMGEIVQGSQAEAISKFFEILLLAGALALSILVSSTAVRLISRFRKVIGRKGTKV